MKKLFFILAIGSLLASCSNKITSSSKNSVPFPGMTVTRADYKLSKDVSGEVEVKEWSTLLGFIRNVKTIGEEKRVTRSGQINGFGLDKASSIAVYKILESNPEFDYLTNIRVTKEYSQKKYFVFTKYNSKIKVVAKGITLKTEK